MNINTFMYEDCDLNTDCVSLAAGKLPCSPEALRAALGRPNTHMLLGSAPVGPTTVARLRTYSTVVRSTTVAYGTASVHWCSVLGDSYGMTRG
jgi:hypothetical protein